MKMQTIHAATLALAFAGTAMLAGAQTTTTIVNSATPGNRTVEHTRIGPNGKASTTATTITQTKDSRNVQTTHIAANGRATTRDVVTTRDAQTGTKQTLIVNGPKNPTAAHGPMGHHKPQDQEATVIASK